MMESTAERPFTLASFQAYMNEGRLMGSRNRATGEVFIPPRPIDPATHGDDMEWVELSGQGTLAAFTSVYDRSRLRPQEALRGRRRRA